MISGRETELESSDSLRLAELERGSMVSKENLTCLRQGPGPNSPFPLWDIGLGLWTRARQY